jgi:hypothetical protein
VKLDLLELYLYVYGIYCVLCGFFMDNIQAKGYLMLISSMNYVSRLQSSAEFVGGLLGKRKKPVLADLIVIAL